MAPTLANMLKPEIHNTMSNIASSFRSSSLPPFQLLSLDKSFEKILSFVSTLHTTGQKEHRVAVGRAVPILLVVQDAGSELPDSFPWVQDFESN